MPKFLVTMKVVADATRTTLVEADSLEEAMTHAYAEESSLDWIEDWEDGDVALYDRHVDEANSHEVTETEDAYLTALLAFQELGEAKAFRRLSEAGCTIEPLCIGQLTAIRVADSTGKKVGTGPSLREAVFNAAFALDLLTP